MPITDSYLRLPLSAIFVPRDDRQRREVNTKGLIESIKAHGVLQPIIVEGTPGPSGRHRLVVGERRYTASLELGLPDIPVRFAEDLSTTERQIIELQENLKRQDLSWQDMVVATEKIHNLYRSLEPSWTQEKTSDAISLEPGPLSKYLRVAREMPNNAKLAECNTINEAYNILTRKDARIEAEVLADIASPGPRAAEAPPGETTPGEIPIRLVPGAGASPSPSEDLIPNPAKSILQESFLHWAPKYTGRPFNLIHCDFPYGIGVFGGPQAGEGRHTGYDDSADLHVRLLDCLLENFDRVASTSCHLVYWFSMQHYDLIRQRVGAKRPDLLIHTHPLIWLKSDNSGIAADPRHGPRHIYETALLLSRGRRPIVQVMADAYSAPSDRTWHVHTKPEPMLRHFFTMLVDNHTALLDPTCGSGSALRAAESLGASRVLGMDIDEQTVGQARQVLRHSRVMRGVSKLAI